MREKIVAGNWKMHTLPTEGEELARAVAARTASACPAAQLVVCPPFTHLAGVSNVLKRSPVALGAQNCATETMGAYTGEVAASMIAALGAEFVIVGHSERRQYYGETAMTLAAKMTRVLAEGMRPIFCVGENLAEREAGEHFAVVEQQLKEVVCLLPAADFKRIVVAYEPVWAIGTGRTATAEQAQEIHAHIRAVLRDSFGDLAENTPILYGGSCKPSNARELFSCADIDGGLIGGAALKADDFLEIGASF